MIASLLALALLTQVGSPQPKTTAKPGSTAPYAVTIQGAASGVPIPISGTVNSAGAADTVGTPSSLGALNNTCTVTLAGQGGAGMFLGSGTLAATLTPEYSNDNGTTWTATSFIDKDGTKTATQAFTNPNAATQLGIVVLGGARAIRVRVSSYTSGSASCTLIATSATSQGAAGGGGGTVSQGGAPWTQRLQDGSGSTLATVTAGNALKVDASATTQPVSASSLPLPTGAATSAKQPALGTAGTASSDVLTVQGITSMTPLKVDGSGVTQPVSASSLPLPTGAATAAKQPALGTAGSASADVLSVQGVASMTAIKVDGSAVTQPVSASALPLPSGASTAAKQPALGTAGSASSDVITVQGISSMTALKTDGSGVTQPVSGTVTVGNQSANTNAVAVRCVNAAGNAFESCAGSGGAGGGTAAYNDGSADGPARSFDADTGAGTEQVAGVILRKSASGGSVEAGTSTNPLRVDVTGSTTQPISGTVTANAGTGTMSTSAAQSGTWTVTSTGAAANGASISGNPVRVGAVGRANGAAPTAVTAGQASDLTTDLEHRLWVQTNHPNTFTCSVSAASSETQCQAAPGSGSLYITDITISASAAITVQLTSGTGTNCATGNAAVSPVLYFAANSGMAKAQASPIKVAATSALCCKPSGASGSCFIQGYTAP